MKEREPEMVRGFEPARQGQYDAIAARPERRPTLSGMRAAPQEIVKGLLSQERTRGEQLTARVRIIVLALVMGYSIAALTFLRHSTPSRLRRVVSSALDPLILGILFSFLIVSHTAETYEGIASVSGFPILYLTIVVAGMLNLQQLVIEP